MDTECVVAMGAAGSDSSEGELATTSRIRHLHCILFL